MRQHIIQSGRLGETIMDSVGNVIPLAWEILKKKKCAINVTTIDNELTVSIIGRFRTKRFRNIDSRVVITDLKRYLQVR